MNEYQIAFNFSGCIAALWVCAYVLSWVGQWAWAWVDDAKVGKDNWMAEKIKVKNKTWIYPVYNCSKSELQRHIKEGRVFGYAKDEKYDGKMLHGDGISIDLGTDYIYTHDSRVASGYFAVPFVTAASPVVIYLSFVFYPLAIGAVTIIAMSNLARYARRHKKAFDEHVKGHRT